MKSRRYENAPNKDERIALAVTPEVKARVFEAAARRGVPASELIRQAVAAVIEDPPANCVLATGLKAA